MLGQNLPNVLTLSTATLQNSHPKGAVPTDTVIPAGCFPNTLTFHKDCDAAGIERRDATDRVIDFHALRTTYTSWLAMTGAHPKVAQALSRHASIETTMERYTDLTLMGTREAIENLPMPKTKRKAGRPVTKPRTWDRRGDRAGA